MYIVNWKLLSFRPLVTAVKREGDPFTAVKYYKQILNRKTIEAEFSPQERKLIETESDDAIVNSLESKWFSSEYNAFDDIFKELPVDFTLKVLNEIKSYYQFVLEAVDRTHNKAIALHQKKIVAELHRVQAIKQQLQVSSSLCVSIRMRLSSFAGGCCATSLRLLAYYRRKVHLANAIKMMESIKNMLQSGNGFKEYLYKKNYAKVIEIYQSLEEKLSNMTDVICLQPLRANISSSISTFAQRLKSALISGVFENAHCCEMAETLRMLDVLNRLDEIPSDICKVYFSRVEDLAKHAHQNFLLGPTSYEWHQSVVTLCKNYCEEINSLRLSFTKYSKLIRKIYKDFPKEKCEEPETLISQEKIRMWEGIQWHVSNALSENLLKVPVMLEDFIETFEHLQIFVFFGELFSSCHSHQLFELISEKAQTFFNDFHKSKVEDIKAMLEAEAWHSLPVYENFDFFSFREFSFVKSINKEAKENQRSILTAIFENFNNPFKDPFLSSLFSVINESLNNNVLQKFTSHQQTKAKSKVITPVTISIAKLIGTYLKVIYVFPDISKGVLEALISIYDIYVFTVFKFFGQKAMTNYNELQHPLMENSHDLVKNFEDSTANENFVKSAKMKMALKRFYKIMTSDLFQAHCNNFFECFENWRSSVTLNNPHDIYGLSYRIIGIESLYVIKDLFNASQEIVNELFLYHQLVPPKLHCLSVSVIPELILFCYSNVLSKIINFDKVLNEMRTCNWDLNHVGSQHNRYVDKMIDELFAFHVLLYKQTSITHRHKKVVWAQALRNAMLVFVEGFSMSEKCTNEGRALMKLDLSQFKSKLQKCYSPKLVPYFSLAEEYINAFYIKESELENWILTNSDYSKKQLNSLLNCRTITDTNLKEKLRLLVELRASK